MLEKLIVIICWFKLRFGRCKEGNNKIENYYSRLPHIERIDKEEDNE